MSRKSRNLRVLILAILIAASAAPQPLLAGASYVIKAGAIIDGTGAPPAKGVSILVTDGKIAAIGRSVTAPEGAEVIDLSGSWVLPGFIDAHVHLTGRQIGEGDWQNNDVRDLPQEDAIRGVRNARLTLAAGFTTVRNVGAGDYSDFALRNAIREGVVPGPRILAAGHSLGITGGHCDTNGFNPGVADRGPDDGIADGVENVMHAVRSQVKRGADVIKFCATGGVLSEGDAVGVQQYTLEEMKAIVEVAHLAERKVAAHAHGNEGIKTALRAGVDSIEHGSILDDEAIALFRETGAWLVPTLMAQDAVESQALKGILTGQRKEKATFIAPKARASFRKAVAGGVKIALGSDAGVYPHGLNGRELVLMVEHGMSPMEAILAGTKGASELLGLQAEIGSLEVGKAADIVAVSDDPLKSIEVVTSPVFVMHDGVVVVRKD
jgi:imidazolonepropionase-like amidohydrolase